MADDRIPLDNNRNLNAQEVAMKLCETTVPVDSDNNEYDLNVLLNVSQIKDMLSKRGKLAYIGQSVNNIIPNNGELHRQFSMKRGGTKAAAQAATTYATYTFVSTEWDGLEILDVVNYKGILYSNYESRIEAEEGYYYMTADGKYVLVGEAGNVESGGWYTKVEFETAEYFAALDTAEGDSGAYTLDPLERWIASGRPTNNGNPLYLYQNVWYSTWKGEGASSETRFNGLAIKYINAMKLYYKRYLNGVEWSSGDYKTSQYAYISTPSITLSGSGTTNATAKTITISVATQAGVDWKATSNQSWATITSGSSGNGNGTITLSITANTSYSSSRSVSITVSDSINGTSTISRVFAVTQSAAARTNVYVYIHHNAPMNRFDVKTSSGGSTSLPFDVTITVEGYDPMGDWWYNGNATLSSGSSSSGVISWPNGLYPASLTITSVSFNPTSPQASGAYNYIFEFKA